MGNLIDKQAAIDAVERITSSMSVCVNLDECHGMKRMQRQAVIELTNLPSAQPDHSGDVNGKVDLIDRQAAVDALDTIHYTDREDWWAVLSTVENLPSAQPDLDSAYTEGYTQAEAKYGKMWDEMPKIIRCRECKYAHLDRNGMCKHCDTWTDDDGYPLELYVDGDFYCGNAERKTDERIQRI